jgi:hypothetical protein
MPICAAITADKDHSRAETVVCEVMVGQERAGTVVCVQVPSVESATAALRVVMPRAARPVCVAAHSAARVAAVVVHAAAVAVADPMAAATGNSDCFISFS